MQGNRKDNATHIPEPQNQNGGGTARVLGLLNQIGDRLIQSEQHREDVRLSLETLENRADLSERIFLTIQDKISKNDSVEAKLIERQDALEKIVSESAVRLARAEALSARIEEAIGLQNRLARRLERTAQDRAQILGKIERIEESVEKTREALNSKALVQLAEQVALSGWLPQTMPANDRLNDEIDAMAPWWKRPYKLQASVVASLLMAGLLGGVALSQLIAHWPQNYNRTPPQIVAQQIPPVAPIIVAQAPVQTPVAAAAAISAPNTEAVSTAPTELAPYSDTAQQAAMDNHQDEVAAALNAITPGVAAVDAPLTPAPAPASATPAVTEPATPAPVVVASAAPTATKPVTAPAQAAAPESFNADNFIKMQMDRSLPLAQRIQPDPALPAMAKTVEDKAFQGVPEAQHDLAAIYTAGHAGVTVDYKRAALWFKEAAANGIANARYNLGVLYHQGLGVDKDVTRAIGWYRTAAQLGHPEAEYNLGIAAIEGIGMPYDAKAAAKYFEQAARGGVMEAAYNLGLIHENGLLGDPDMNEAIYWYKVSSDSSPEAKAALTQTAKALNLNDSDVDRIVREYNAVYKIPAKAAVEKAGFVTPAKAAPVKGKQAALDSPEVLARVLPKLSKEDSQNLLGSVRRDQAMIAQTQEQLMRLKLFPGPADGVGGPQTEDAIRTYQKQHNMIVTGKPSENLLGQMLANDTRDGALAQGE